MKNDLITAIVVAVLGIAISYFTCNLFMGDATPVTVKTLDSNITADLPEPDVNVFNAKALNPTVEVYVGNCQEYNQYGECIDQLSDPISDGSIEENPTDGNNNNQSNSGNSSSSSSSSNSSSSSSSSSNKSTTKQRNQ